MAKQTFTVGQVLTAAQLTSLQQTAMSGGAASAKTTNYVLVAADAGTAISMTSTSATTVTVNSGLFAAGDTVFIQNLGSGNLTITAGTATVNTAGSLILPQYDAGILYFVSASSAVFYDYIQVGAASPLTTKGDVYGFGTSDARIPIGANDTVLTADSTQALGLKWAAPAGGGGMTLLSTTTLSGANTTVSVGSGYNSILGIVFGVTNNTGNGRLLIAPNGTTNLTQLSGVARYPSTSNLYGVSNGYIDLTIGYDTLRTNANNSFQFEIHNYTSSTAYKNITGCAVYVNNDSANQSTNLAGGFSDTTAITSLVFSQSGGNFSAGTVLLYGVK